MKIMQDYAVQHLVPWNVMSSTVLRRVRAFTLIELLVVIAIIGLISSVVIANLSEGRNKSQLAAGKHMDSTLRRSLGSELLLQWKLDECSGSTIQDTSGNNYHGSIQGSAAWNSTSALYDRGCSMDFSSGSRLALSSAYGPFDVEVGEAATVSAWFKNGGFSGTNQTIVWKNGSCNGWYVEMTSSGQLRGIFRTGGCGGASYTITSPGGLGDGRWHHVALSVDRIKNITTLYVDGESVGTVNITDSNTGTGGEFRIGNNWNNTASFIGSIDEVHFFQTTLSQLSARDLYERGLRSRQLAGATSVF